MTRIAVSENHQRSIGVTLTEVDEALGEFERWADGREVRSVLHTEENDLPPDDRAAIRAEIPEIRALLADLRDALDLKGRTQTGRNVINARCTSLWVHLADLTERHLSGYGKLPEGLMDYLRPRVAELIARLNGIAWRMDTPQTRAVERDRAAASAARKETTMTIKPALFTAPEPFHVVSV